MIFNSLTFLAFLLPVVGLYWVLPRRARLWLLFLASLVFYGFWDWSFVPLLLLSVATDYAAGLLLGRLEAPKRRRAVLWAAMGVNLAILGIFKYLIFFAEGLGGLARLLGMGEPDGFSVSLHIILPLGISFYTFQSMSYTIDVWRRAIKPCREFVLFATYVVFFPQLVAGPILRAGEVIWQLDRRPAFHLSNLSDGLTRIGSGLLLKCVLADNLAPMVDAGFLRPAGELGAADVLTLAFLFGFQIYFDFAGYSHIALGAARLMGIVFPENFNFPYLARSPKEFWRRWHITLGSWIRDYLYLPLCGAHGGTHSEEGLSDRVDMRSQPGFARRFRALWLSWALMGLWHGANWTFVLWGLWHAAFVSLQRLWELARLPRLPSVLAWGLTLQAMMLGWIPFRAESLGDALALWQRIVTPSAWLRPDTMPDGLPVWLALSRDSYYAAAAILAAILIASALGRLIARKRASDPAALPYLEPVCAICAAPLILFFLQPIEQFIYFQF